MSSFEHQSPKPEYTIADFYYELADLQRKGDLKEVHLDDLDESDIEIYLAFKKMMIGLKDFESPTRGDDLKSYGGIRIKSNQFNIKDEIRKRRSELTYNGGNPAQILFLDYISRKVDEAYGF